MHSAPWVRLRAGWPGGHTKISLSLRREAQKEPLNLSGAVHVTSCKEITRWGSRGITYGYYLSNVFRHIWDPWICPELLSGWPPLGGV